MDEKNLSLSLGSPTLRIQGEQSSRNPSRLRINKPSDDPAGLAVVKRLETEAAVFERGVANINTGTAVALRIDEALTSLKSILTDIRTLRTEAEQATLTGADRKALNREAQALSDEFTRIAQQTSLNRLNLLSGALGEVRLQGGFGTEASLQSMIGGNAGEGTYTSPTSYFSEAPTDVATGDLDNDGAIDIVTSNRGVSGSSVRVFIGDGQGTFNPPALFSLGEDPAALAVGDLNGDGALDIVTANYDAVNPGLPSTLSVFLGQGDGSFGMSNSYSIQAGARDLTLVDVNNDANLDAVVTLPTEDVVSVSLGVGDGTFATAASYQTGATPYSVATADLNGDGKLDLAVSNSNDSTLSLLIGQGDGSFTNAGSLSTALAPSNIGIADLNDDGTLDIAFRELGRLSLFLGDGSGGYSAVMTLSDITGISDFALTDANGDGSVDVAYSQAISFGLPDFSGFLLNDGTGVFQAATSTLTTTENIQDIAVGDFNGDGIIDSAAINGSGSRLYTLLGNSRNSGIGAILPFSLETRADALQAKAILDRKADELTAFESRVEGFKRRTLSASGNLSVQANNARVARNRILDVDEALETAKGVAQRTKEESKTALLAQANQIPLRALRLIDVKTEVEG